MNIKAIDKVLLVLLSLVLLAVGLLGICVALGVASAVFLTSICSSFWGALLVGVISALIVILTFRVLIAFLRKPGEGKTQSALVSTGEFGSTYVSYAAIDAMVQRHCKGNARIKECVSSVRSADTEEGVKLFLKLTVQNDVEIPQLTEDLIQSLKVYVEQLSGVAIRDIKVVVESAPVQKVN